MSLNNYSFRDVAAVEGSENWDKLIARKTELYEKAKDCRNPFERDYTRILHSLAYRRLKHKTQVFFNISNDHICTRMEHVSHVESVSTTIAKDLGLSVELTRAIAIGHDLGHAPFGHHGERILNKLSLKYLGKSFFHEKNGLRFVDNLELLEDDKRCLRTLDLTYAVRDGIISHCGELDENSLKPREDYIDLNSFTECGQYQPFTWEGCVVKISDKIAYVGRDIEDAIRLNFIDRDKILLLSDMAKGYDKDTFNTTVIIHNMIYDICENSSPEKGICLSDDFFRQLKEIKEFNYREIYGNERLKSFEKYSELVINELFDTLFKCYDGENTISVVHKKEACYPELMSAFADWLSKFCEAQINLFDNINEKNALCKCDKIYGMLETEEIYAQAIIDFISGMSDTYAIKVFNELITY